jgi:hypothetical protein
VMNLALFRKERSVASPRQRFVRDWEKSWNV